MKIVERIAAHLKLDEKGKLEKFFNRIIKRMKSDLEAAQHNLSSLKLEYKGKLARLKDQLEDSQTGISEAFDNVPVKVLTTNKAMDDYADTYLKGIKSAENLNAKIQEEIKDLEASHKKEVDDLAATILKIKERIASLEN